MLFALVLKFILLAKGTFVFSFLLVQGRKMILGDSFRSPEKSKLTVPQTGGSSLLGCDWCAAGWPWVFRSRRAGVLPVAHGRSDSTSRKAEAVIAWHIPGGPQPCDPGQVSQPANIHFPVWWGLMVSFPAQVPSRRQPPHYPLFRDFLKPSTSTKGCLGCQMSPVFSSARELATGLHLFMPPGPACQDLQTPALSSNICIPAHPLAFPVHWASWPLPCTHFALGFSCLALSPDLAMTPGTALIFSAMCPPIFAWKHSIQWRTVTRGQTRHLGHDNLCS